MSEVAHVSQPQVPAPPRQGGGAALNTREYKAQQVSYAPSTAPAQATATSGHEGPGSQPHHPTYTTHGTLHIAGSSAMYTLLGLLLLIAGILALIMPYRLTDVVFRGERKYFDVIFEELWRILGATFFSGAITAYALKTASDRHLLNDPVVQRLQLGFFWFSLLAIILHLVHLFFIKSITLWGLLIGAAIMTPVLIVPTAHLSMSGGFGLAIAVDNIFTSLGNIFSPRRVNFSIILYSFLTVVFFIVGLGYVILPKLTLKWALGYYAGKRAVFLWQWIGSGMLFLFPAITYTCLERGLERALWGSVPKTLNVALLVASLFQILEFGGVWATEGIQGRWLLPVLLVHWFLTLLASILGLATEGPPAYEYQPLSGQSGGGGTMGVV